MLFLGHFSDMRHAISARLANPNRGRGHLPHNFWSSYEYLSHFQPGDSHAR